MIIDNKSDSSVRFVDDAILYSIGKDDSMYVFLSRNVVKGFAIFGLSFGLVNHGQLRGRDSFVD